MWASLLIIAVAWPSVPQIGSLPAARPRWPPKAEGIGSIEPAAAPRLAASRLARADAPAHAMNAMNARRPWEAYALVRAS